MVFRTTTEDGNEEYVWYVVVEEEELLEGVELDRFTVQNKRGE